MNLGNEIKKLAIDNSVTLTYLAEGISRKKGKHYSVQNLSAKLKKGTANLNELVIIMEILGYKIKFEKEISTKE
ncbi:MAG: hypothetical protein A2039_03930 [Candidatus Melainabacteria bacterium GWA2_34_9]|nr:MAG: hypothetical protein A2039_03930 [Candidatus Melainabacteria bacterium GWA2_34_9]